MKQLRRTQLYVPGNSPSMLQNCAIYGADGVLLDLEDSVSIFQKDVARYLVASALKNIDFGKTEVHVRINASDTEFWKDDIRAIVPLKPDALRVPKTSSPEDVKQYDDFLKEVEKENGIEVGSTKIVTMLETAIAIEKAYDIAISSDRIIAITIGGEDLTAAMHIARTKEGKELDWARAKVALAAHAAGVDVLDTVYSDVNDDEGLAADTAKIKQLGFNGKACINPRQIPVIHSVFNPTEKEIEKSKAIVKAAMENEGGVVSLNGKMIDYPVVKRAEHILQLAGINKEEIGG